MVTGVQVFGPDPRTLAWARAAHAEALSLTSDPEMQAANLRHGSTWFVGVDALRNAADGNIAGVPLDGVWRHHVSAPETWHRAQLSVVYPGYPGRDPDESDTAHRFRRDRFAAHVDGLLPIGPERMRFLREPHGFILGLPLTRSDAAPLMVWPGSHLRIGAAFRQAIGARDPFDVDLTETYHAIRSAVFDEIAPQPVHAQPGQGILLHRHLLHGVAPWREVAKTPPEGRMIAYFRPQITAAGWLSKT